MVEKRMGATQQSSKSRAAGRTSRDRDGPIVEEDFSNANANVDDENGTEETVRCWSGSTCCNAKLRQISVNSTISGCETVTWSSIFWLVTSFSLVAMAWVTLFFLIGKEVLPGGAAYPLFVLPVAAYALGWSLAYLPYLNIPPVFGMLLAGIIWRNSGMYDAHEEIGRSPIIKIRTFCLTFITLRAGLQLTTTPIIRYPFFILSLALLPCTFEVLGLTLSSYCILNYPWDWAFLTGTIIACMSPVVTVNCVLALADRGYGEDKGMATLLCTATSIDDVHIVSLYSICFSIVFSVDGKKTDWSTYIPGGLRDILLGFIAGSFLGIFFVYFPHRDAKYVSWYRLGCLILGALMCTSAASTIAITGGGYLATIIMSFIATTGWRITDSKFDVTPMRKAVFFIWHFMQPILVGSIGVDIDFSNWSGRRFGLHVACILIGLMVRSVVCILTTYRTNFNTKERIFVALAWLSKGTLQAAMASMVYENAILDEDPVRLEIANDIVRISVFSIILLAPLSAIIMMVSGPLLLNKVTNEEAKRERLLSQWRVMTQLQPIMTGNHRQRAHSSSATPSSNP